MTDRVKKLKSSIVNKSFRGGKFAGDVYLDTERAHLWTQSYQETKGQPEIIRRARTLEKVLDNMTLYIKEGEVIVGNTTPTPNALIFYPEISSRVVKEALNGGFIPEEQKEKAQWITERWKGKTLHERVDKELSGILSKTEKRVIDACCNVASIDHKGGHTLSSPNFPYLFKVGLNGIIEKIEQELKKTKQIDDLSEVPQVLKKRHLLEAMLITCKAVIRWARRYSKLAEELASKEQDPDRKRELLEVSMVCDRVPANPCTSFHESLQTFFFVHLIDHYIERLANGVTQRADQIFYPYYEKDVIREKNITREEAQELIECLWIKLTELGHFHIKERRDTYQGTNVLQVFTIAGVKENGEDASNELTLTILDATKDVRLNQPSLALRYHNKISTKVLTKALEVIKTGMGMPSFQNDAVMVPILMDCGASLQQARNCASEVCIAPTIPGLQMTSRRYAWNLQSILCLELALNDGIDILTGERLGPPTGDPKNFQSYDEVLEAFREQVKFAVGLGCKVRNITRWYESQYFYRPFTSALFENTLIVGKDVIEWEEIPVPHINVCGQVDSADSLAAIKKLVFDEKRYTMEELLNALKGNWEGYEEMRQEFINDAPKFGNDDDYVDLIARKDVFDLVEEECNKCKDLSGAVYSSVPQSVTRFMRYGKMASAMPNGRKAGDPLADAGISPYMGYDRRGPTAVLKSGSKIDHTSLRACLLNQRLSPTILDGTKGEQLFLNYIKTWADLGLYHVQFNVVDSKVLKDAQKNPEKYPDLMVRVAGYSAFFNDLTRETQDAIINRTEHGQKV